MQYLFRCESCGLQQTFENRLDVYQCYCTHPPNTMVRVFSFAGTVFTKGPAEIKEAAEDRGLPENWAAPTVPDSEREKNPDWQPE